MSLSDRSMPWNSVPKSSARTSRHREGRCARRAAGERGAGSPSPSASRGASWSRRGWRTARRNALSKNRAGMPRLMRYQRVCSRSALFAASSPSIVCVLDRSHCSSMQSIHAARSASRKSAADKLATAECQPRIRAALRKVLKEDGIDIRLLCRCLGQHRL